MPLRKCAHASPVSRSKTSKNTCRIYVYIIHTFTNNWRAHESILCKCGCLVCINCLLTVKMVQQILQPGEPPWPKHCKAGYVCTTYQTVDRQIQNVCRVMTQMVEQWKPTLQMTYLLSIYWLVRFTGASSSRKITLHKMSFHLHQNTD